MAIRPFLRHAPGSGALPLVLDSPHSGEHYPDDFDHAPPRAIVRQAERQPPKRRWTACLSRPWVWQAWAVAPFVDFLFEVFDQISLLRRPCPRRTTARA